MKIKLISIFTVLLISYSSCQKSDGDNKPSDPVIPDIQLSEKGEQLVSSSNAFGFDLFKNINDSEEDNKNIFISPLSVSFALAMTYNGADGDTKTAMEEALKLSGLTTDEINSNFKSLMNALVNLDPKVVLTIANSIWYRDSFDVLQDFIDVNQEYYDAEVSALNFSDPASVDIINNWVANKTNDKIKEIINCIPQDAVMYLINAIYFNGTWKYEFKEEDTTDDPFYLMDGSTKNVPMMHQEITVDYFSNDDFQAVDMYYGGEKYSMLVLLPKQDKSVNDIIAQLDDENWNSMINSFTELGDVIIGLPKFKFEYKNTLNDMLAKMGMGIAFNENLADFGKINPDYQLFISRVIHKTYVDVNEQGTEAAAVTAVEIGVTSFEPNKNFIVNKPFIFVIKEKSTNAIIFMGKVVEPVYE
ncbi:MAG: serpin family protein [Bacteroidales bacterium]|nr:serpin family protein [Bacteroidales bacterium]